MAQHDDDPFAPKTEEAPVVQVRVPDNPRSADEVMVAVAEAARDEVVVTLKGTGELPWIVIHTNSVANAVSHFNSDLLTLMERAQNATVTFAGLRPAPVAVSSAPTPTSNVPAGAQSAPNNETRQCKHGAMTYKTGSKGGRTWKAFMCPTPKGAPDQCEPQWIRD